MSLRERRERAYARCLRVRDVQRSRCLHQNPINHTLGLTRGSGTDLFVRRFSTLSKASELRFRLVALKTELAIRLGRRSGLGRKSSATFPFPDFPLSVDV